MNIGFSPNEFFIYTTPPSSVFSPKFHYQVSHTKTWNNWIMKTKMRKLMIIHVFLMMCPISSIIKNHEVYKNKNKKKKKSHFDIYYPRNWENLGNKSNDIFVTKKKIK